MVERLSREVIIIKTFLVFVNEYNLYLEFLVIICLNNRLTKDLNHGYGINDIAIIYSTY